MITYKHRAVLIQELGEDPATWAEVNRLCEEGFEVFRISLHKGCLSTCTVVYLRNPVGCYVHTETCPNCHKPLPK